MRTRARHGAPRRRARTLAHTWAQRQHRWYRPPDR